MGRYGPVPSEGKGHTFESCRVRQEGQYQTGHAKTAPGSVRMRLRTCDVGLRTSTLFTAQRPDPSRVRTPAALMCLAMEYPALLHQAMLP